MRNLFFVLIVANVLYFAWQNWVRDGQQEGVVVVDRESLGEPLPVVRDDAPRDTQTQDIAAVDNEPARVAKAVIATLGRTCLSVGPFTEVDEATAELKALKANGVEVAQRAAQGSVFIGHWVYVDNIPTRSQARGLLNRLQTGGIKEAYLIAGNRGEDVISLGIFSGREGAERTELQAKSIGVEAQMDNRYRQATVFWLDVRLKEGELGSQFVDDYGQNRVVLGTEATCPPQR
ncbi:MAG: hypothetical protein AAF270_11540 [Pseudomonadota bacterium]